MKKCYLETDMSWFLVDLTMECVLWAWALLALWAYWVVEPNSIVEGCVHLVVDLVVVTCAVKLYCMLR